MAITDLTGLEAHWRLDGDGTDAHGSNDLTNSGSTPYTTGTQRNGGVFLQAAKFRGVSTQYLYIADNASLSTGDVDFTVAAVYWPTTASGVEIGRWSASNNREWLLWFENSTNRFVIQIYNSAGSAVGHVYSGAVTDNHSHLVIAWHDSTANTVNIQVNNGTVLSAATTGAPSDKTCDFRINGVNVWGTANIESVSFWKGRILDSDERAALWNGGFVLDYPFGSTGSPFVAGETGISPNGRGAVANVNQAIFRTSLNSAEIAGTRYQVTTFWSHTSHLVLGWRALPAGNWTLYTYTGAGGLPGISLGTQDGHNVASVGIDPDGYVHVVYDLHVDALKYAKSDAPITSWTGGLSTGLSMLGTNEDGISYPMFVNDPSGTLYFIFRNGGVGTGNAFFYEYDESTATWAAATGTGTAGLLVDAGSNIVYHDIPVFDSDFGAGGYMHLSYMYRDLSVKGWDYTYIKWDGTDWYKADGTAQTIPISQSNDTPFDTANTIMNQNSIDVDSDGYPHIAYWKYDGSTGDQLYHASYDGSTWTITQLTTGAGRDMFTVGSGRPFVFVDRNTDEVYILYRDDADIDGLLQFKSDAGDFTTWTQSEFYAPDVGNYEPQADRSYWRDSQVLNIYMAPWPGMDGQAPITVVEWEPDSEPPTPSEHQPRHSAVMLSGVAIV